MVELYCELLLARAGVLDGLAFGESGTRARARVREEAVAQNQHQNQQGKAATGGATGDSKSGGGGGLFRIFGAAGTKQTSQQQPQHQQPTTGKDTQTQSPGEDAAGDETYYLDAALDEAATAIFYAWSRFPTEVRELTLLRSLLTDRYGKDFMNLASENKLAGVKAPERLVKGLRVRPPSAELVESYLKEIARAYKVPWGETETESQVEGDVPDVDVGDFTGGDGDGGQGGGGGDLDDQVRVGEVVRRASETAELSRATPPRGFNPHSSPVSVAPPGPRSDNPNPRVKVPDDKDGDSSSGTKAGVSSPSPSPSAQRRDKSGIPDVDELSRRFAALKR